MSKWHGNEVYAKWYKEMERRLKKACIFLTNQIKKEISEGYPPASHPGQPPHVRTGELRRSISWSVDEAKLIGRVGSNKIYAGYLERGTDLMAARPYLEATLEKNKGVVKRLLIGKKL